MTYEKLADVNEEEYDQIFEEGLAAASSVTNSTDGCPVLDQHSRAGLLGYIGGLASVVHPSIEALGFYPAEPKATRRLTTKDSTAKDSAAEDSAAEITVMKSFHRYIFMHHMIQVSQAHCKDREGEMDPVKMVVVGRKDGEYLELDCERLLIQGN